MKKEYDFSGGVRGKYAKKYEEGVNIVKLDEDVTKVFPTSQSVNEALRTLINLTSSAQGSFSKNIIAGKQRKVKRSLPCVKNMPISPHEYKRRDYRVFTTKQRAVIAAVSCQQDRAFRLICQRRADARQRCGSAHFIDLDDNISDVYDTKNALKDFLSTSFGRDVDIAREKYLKPYAKEHILKDTLVCIAIP